MIDGDEGANDRLVEQRPGFLPRVPVWHMHESDGTLAAPGRKLADGRPWQFRRVANTRHRSVVKADGFSDEYHLDDQDHPECRLHGLRMLDPAISQSLALASADSTNAAVNSGSISRLGMHTPPSAGQRASVIADRIESHTSSPIWQRESQTELAL